jgi:hypothetical protein
MINKPLILVSDICKHYNLELSFINSLQEVGLIEIVTKQNNIYILEEHLADLEKMMRMYIELEINVQGIDAIINLLYRINQLQQELLLATNRNSNFAIQK